MRAKAELEPVIVCAILGSIDGSDADSYGWAADDSQVQIEQSHEHQYGKLIGLCAYTQPKMVKDFILKMTDS
jgi:hypothetical protein